MKFLHTLLIFILLFGCKSAEEIDIQLDAKLIANLIMVGIRGTEFNIQDPLHRAASEHHVAGIIIFDYDVPTKSRPRNVENPEQLKRLNSELRTNISEDLLIAIDQEGGKVNRLKTNSGFTDYPSQQEVASNDTNYDAEKVYSAQAQQLANLGFNINFSPVVDVNTNENNPIIGSLGRSFSENADTVYKYAKIAIEEFTSCGIYPVLKHFPGHGSSKNDSHLGVVDVSDSWSNYELIPYNRLFADSLEFGIMTAHIYNANLDREYPATLSKKTISGLLKSDMGYPGIVISDDLQMEAIRNEYSLERTIELSLNAGVDLLLFANNSIYDEQIIEKTIQIIVDLNRSGKVSTERLMESISKVKELKQKLAKYSDG